MKVLALVVKHPDDDHAFVAACMDHELAAIMDQEEFDAWKTKVLRLASDYDVREVVLNVDQGKLDALFSAESIDAEVEG